MSAVGQITQQREVDAAISRAGSDRVVVLYFTATWCGPCKMIGPHIDKLSNQFKQVIFCKIDIDQARPVASSYRISAVPTLVFIKNRQTVETLKGANPSAIEAALKKHAGSPNKNYTEASAGPVDKALQGHTSLLDQVDASQTNCLNEAPSHTLKDLLKGGSSSAYLESDADEQLIMGIAFLQAVKLFALRLTTKEANFDNAPKTIKIFADQPTLGFDEAASQDATQEFELTKEQAQGKELILLRYVKFQKTNYISVFIVDNHGGEDTTRIDKIEIFGTLESATGSMSGLRGTDDE